MSSQYKATAVTDAGAKSSSWQRNTAAIPLMFAILILLFSWHIAVGAKPLPLRTVLEALLHYDPSLFDHIIVRDLRLPRALTAALVGASLGVAGSLMQAVTRNPLAEPSILGLMAGASFAVVMVVGVFDLVSVYWLPWVAALGALVTASLVWLIALWAPGGTSPLTLTLAGAAVTALLSALIAVAHLLDQETFEQLRIWLAGSLAGRRREELVITAPWMLLALALACALAPRVSVLAMGEEVAQALGVRTGWLKVQVLLGVVLLTACSVALAGPLGFVGLVIPHAVRLFVGADYRWIIPYAALAGATYLLGVDIIARLVMRPQEIATGIVTALVGAPLFVHLVRQRAR